MIIYYHMTQMKKYKIYSAIMSVCILLTSCSSGGGGSYETDSKAFSDAAVTSVSSVTATTAPVTTVQVTTAPVTTVPETTKVTTTAKPKLLYPPLQLRQPPQQKSRNGAKIKQTKRCM